jgi:zinc/manganese transport system permease protein
VFYAMFALAITASVQLVGVYLVFASLIVPALATAGMRGRGRMVAAYLIGVLGYALGLALSAVLDLPSGALIVWTLAGCALAAQLVPAVRRSHPAHDAPEAVFEG